MTKCKDMVTKISLAGLLHDCGKIVYRSLNERKNHSLLGRELLAEYCLDNDILQAVEFHHGRALAKSGLASNHIAYIIYEADNIAAGIDRRTDTDEAEEGTFAKYGPLESIFNHLTGKCEKTEKKYYYLRGLGENDKINYGISKAELAIQASKDKYERLLVNFTENLHRLLMKDGKISKENFTKITPAQLLKITEAVCSYMPSSTLESEAVDISLYDHAKMTAAIANAMYLYFADNGVIDYKAACMGRQNELYRQKNIFLLVSGDMSGIQNFIYTISSAGALKSLRGRSFYLDMVLEHMVDELLDLIELNRCNLLYTGGGHFYLLAPNTTKVIEVLKQLKSACNDWFLQNTGTTLYIEIGWQECSAVNFMTVQKNKEKSTEYEKTGEIFRQLSNKLSKQKLQRYNSEQLVALFEPVSHINKTLDSSRECGICHNSSTELKPFHGKTDGKTNACDLCNKLYDFGKNILEENKYIFAVIKDKKGLPLPATGNQAYSLHALNEDELNKCSIETIKRLYTKNASQIGNLFATNLWVGDYNTRSLSEEKTADFLYLAEQSQGIKRLGVLRADVDRLGQTFATAFRDDTGAHYLTLSRVATLSRQLSLFFKKYINYICQGNIAGENETVKHAFSLWGKQKQARKLAIVYSGGDDLFVVGAWDDVLEFSVDLYQALQRFTAGRITISAGMAMLDHNYPVSQMANIAGQLETIAKDSGRNRIALLDATETMWVSPDDNQKKPVHCYPWHEFIYDVIGEKLQFLLNEFNFSGEFNDSVEATSIGRGKLPIGKGQLYKLVTFLRKRINGSEQQQDKPQRMNVVRFIYWLARLEPKKNNEELKKAYGEVKEKLYKWVVDDDIESSRGLLTAVLLIIYGIRSKNNTENDGIINGGGR